MNDGRISPPPAPPPTFFFSYMTVQIPANARRLRKHAWTNETSKTLCLSPSLLSLSVSLLSLAVTPPLARLASTPLFQHKSSTQPRGRRTSLEPSRNAGMAITIVLFRAKRFQDASLRQHREKKWFGCVKPAMGAGGRGESRETIANVRPRVTYGLPDKTFRWKGYRPVGSSQKNAHNIDEEAITRAVQRLFPASR